MVKWLEFNEVKLWLGLAKGIDDIKVKLIPARIERRKEDRRK